MSKRYYVQYSDGMWEIFDREFVDPQGEVCAIAICYSRTPAFKIRDALNQLTERRPA